MNDSDESEPSLAFPLVVWLAVQLIALAIGVAGVPLSAQSVQPAGALAIQVMLTVQAAGAAMLWPWLFACLRRSMVVIATTLPFVQAAGFVSATPMPSLLAATGILLLWLSSLAMLPAQRFGAITNTVVRGVLVLLAIGGALAGYLGAEFADPQSPTAATGPVIWALSKLTSETHGFSWIYGTGIFILAALARFVMHRTGRRSPQLDGGGNGVRLS